VDAPVPTTQFFEAKLAAALSVCSPRTVDAGTEGICVDCIEPPPPAHAANANTHNKESAFRMSSPLQATVGLIVARARIMP
jgi:hypothetical protein